MEKINDDDVPFMFLSHLRYHSNSVGEIRAAVISQLRFAKRPRWRAQSLKPAGQFSFSRISRNSFSARARASYKVYLSLMGRSASTCRGERHGGGRSHPRILSRMIHPLLCQKAFNLPPVVPCLSARLMQDTRCSRMRAVKTPRALSFFASFAEWNRKIWNVLDW